MPLWMHEIEEHPLRDWTVEEDKTLNMRKYKEYMKMRSEICNKMISETYLLEGKYASNIVNAPSIN